MHDMITHALALAIDSKDPPKEIRLFKAGLNHSLKGPVLFDEKAAADVMASWKAMGHSLTIDYDHGSIRKDAIDPSKSGKSAGRFDLELRDGELWAVNIRWAPEAEAAIRREEWPFISPAFASDATGRPTLVLNFGLTGNPALLDPPRLIAAAIQDHDIRTENTTMKWNALNDYMKQMGCTKPAMAAALGLSVEALDGLMGGDGMMTPEQEMMMKRCPPAVGPSMMSTVDMVQLSALSVLAGKPGAGRDDVLARVGELQSGSVQLLSATGCATMPAALARVTQLFALSASLLQVTGAASEADALAKVKHISAMSATIEEQAKRSLEQRVDGLISEAKAANKITPAEIGGTKGLRAMGLGDPEWLEEHLKHRTAITTLSAGDINEGHVDTGVTVTGTLAGLAEKDGIVALNGVPYEKLGGDVKHNLAAGAPAEQRAFKALRANWQKRGEPVVAA